MNVQGFISLRPGQTTHYLQVQDRNASMCVYNVIPEKDKFCKSAKNSSLLTNQNQAPK